MTVSVLSLHSTDAIVKPGQFYSAEIKVPHHQLRNFISTVYDGRIYYVNNFDVFLLDLGNNQRSLLATVPFEARCLAAAHGWVCVGGEMKGDCAFIRIGEENSKPGNFCHDLIVDMLGKEIVNSMTIHRLKHSENRKEETVVLISNNDRTVTIYSLSQQEILTILEHPVPMNYAALSPDSTVIAAVGDSNEVYFYERIDVVPSSEPTDGLTEYPEYDWRPLAVPPVPMGESEYEDFSFSVAFSPSGRLCAVSSQGGSITVFDMHAITKQRRSAEEAILCNFRSSRTSMYGCVRSMAFSPEPWELLAWAEDHGRIGIADVRQGFLRRQHLELNKDAATLVDIEDATPTELRNLGVKERLRQQHLQRMRALRGHPPIGARSLDDPSNQYSTRDSLPFHQRAGLDARERSVLEALETTIDEVDGENTGPFSINYTSLPRVRPSAGREYDVELLNPSSRLVPQREPRRRSSVVLSDSNANRQQLSVEDSTRTLMTASPGPISDDGSIPHMSTNDLTPSSGTTSSQPLPYHIPPSDPWHVIEASLAPNRNERSSAFERPAGVSQIEAAIQAERQLSDRLERQLADERRLSTLLRSELEARERLLEARQQELVSQQSAPGRLSPSLERVLQRQLQSEHQNGRQRSEELENEIRNNTRRVDQLILQRDSLLLRLRVARDDESRASAQSSVPSTSTSEAPAQSESHDTSRMAELERTLRQLEEDRRNRRQRMQDLESQVRRAESRVELASLQNSIERAENRDALRERHTMMMAPSGIQSGSASAFARAAAAANGSENTSTTSIGSPLFRRMRHRSQGEPGAFNERATIPRNSELAGRVTENDMRLARLMIQRAAMDGNGNWSSAGFQRLFGGRPVANNRSTAVEELVRDAGIGTAGIGWSPDGQSLFAGSEQGIFQFSLNVQDRFQFPIIEMR